MMVGSVVKERGVAGSVEQGRLRTKRMACEAARRSIAELRETWEKEGERCCDGLFVCSIMMPL